MGYFANSYMTGKGMYETDYGPLPVIRWSKKLTRLTNELNPLRRNEQNTMRIANAYRNNNGAYPVQQNNGISAEENLRMDAVSNVTPFEGETEQNMFGSIPEEQLWRVNGKWTNQTGGFNGYYNKTNPARPDWLDEHGEPIRKPEKLANTKQAAKRILKAWDEDTTYRIAQEAGIKLSTADRVQLGKKLIQGYRGTDEQNKRLVELLRQSGGGMGIQKPTSPVNPYLMPDVSSGSNYNIGSFEEALFGR